MVALKILKLPAGFYFIPLALPTILYILEKPSKIKSSVIVSGWLRSSIKLQIFLCLHLFYVWFFFNDIFTGCVSVNIQLLLLLQSSLYYINYPLSSYERNLANNFLNFFGFALLFGTVISKYGFDIFQLDISINSSERSFGFLGDQEAWVFTIFATIYLFRQNYFYYFLFVSGILLNGSITPFVIIGVTTIFFLHRRLSKGNLYSYVAGFLFIVLFCLVVDVGKLHLVARIFDVQSLLDGGSAGHRLLALESTLNYLGSNFLLGWGNYNLYVQNEYKDILQESDMGSLTYLSSSNNQIIDIYLHFGLVGLIIFVSYLKRFVQLTRTFSNSNTDDGFYLGIYFWLVAFIFFNQTAVWFIPGSFTLVLLLLFVSTFDVKYLDTRNDVIYEQN
jgi:hypothetical protein